MSGHRRLRREYEQFKISKDMHSCVHGLFSAYNVPDAGGAILTIIKQLSVAAFNIFLYRRHTKNNCTLWRAF